MAVISYRANGTTSNLERVFLYKDSGATSGTEADPFLSLSATTTGLVIAAIANNQGSVTSYTALSSNIETATVGSFSAPTAGKCRLAEIDSVSMPGLYEIQLPDSLYAVTSAKYLDICVTGATDLATFHGRVYLDVIDAAAIDQVLQDYDSSSGVVSNTDLNARTIAAANIPTKTDVSDVSTDVNSARDTILADILETAQVICRSDAAIATDNATKVTEINTDEGSGAGDYDPTVDSLEGTGAIVFTKAGEVDVNVKSINDVTVTGVGTSADLWRA